MVIFLSATQKDILKRPNKCIVAAELDMAVSAPPCVYDSAAILIKPEDRMSVDEMVTWCRELLDTHNVPRYIAFLDVTCSPQNLHCR